MKNQPSINVLIPSYQVCKFPYLTMCVNSILGGTYTNIKVTVGVNGSNELLELVQTLPVDVYYSEENLGWIKMMNILVDRNESDFVLYCADDLEFDPDCMTTAMNAMEELFSDGDGLVTFNIKNTGVSTEGDTKFTYHGVMGRKYIERFPKGFCFCPDYNHGYGDLEIGIYAIRLHKQFYCEQAKLFQYLIRETITKSVDESQVLATKKISNDTTVHRRRKRLGLLWGESDKLVRNH